MDTADFRTGIARLEVAYRSEFTPAEFQVLTDEFSFLPAAEWAGFVAFTIVSYPDQLPTIARLHQLHREYHQHRRMVTAREGSPAWKSILNTVDL